MKPDVSVVINTLNRAHCIGTTLKALEYQDYEGIFEVVVVNGPSTDNTLQVLERHSKNIKFVQCSVANLSISRNIGINSSAGEIICFLDDDAIPESQWLAEIVEGYETSRVGGVGGFVFDYTGFGYQATYELIDRFGNPHPRDFPEPYLCYPGSPKVPHLLGANSSFRKSALLSINGFDEEFEYFLDESDVIIRLVDQGWEIRQLSRAYVHHKSAASALRAEDRIINDWRPIIKNTFYFAYKHNRLASPTRISGELLQWEKQKRDWLKSDKAHNYDSFDQVFENASIEGIAASRRNEGISGIYPNFDQASNNKNKNLKQFSSKYRETNSNKRQGMRIVLISKNFPPAKTDGIARFTQSLAESLARQGCNVHVITLADGGNQLVDFNGNYWIHFINPLKLQHIQVINGIRVPYEISEWSYAAHQEIERIRQRMPIDIVEFPIWDIEGIAILANTGRSLPYKVAVSLHTSFMIYLESNPHLKTNKDYLYNFGDSVIALEKLAIENCDIIRANSRAIVKEIEHLYGIRMRPNALSIVHHGIAGLVEHHSLEFYEPSQRSTFTVLFVGRFEPRKGIEDLLKAIPLVFKDSSSRNISFRLAGNSSPSNNPLGKDYVSEFIGEYGSENWISAVHFLGPISDEDLWREYANCSVVVFPSKFESLGLVALEAMRSGRPIITPANGGTREIVDTDCAFLLSDTYPENLAQAIINASKDSKKLRSMSIAAAKNFNNRFTQDIMAKNSIIMYKKHLTHPHNSFAIQRRPKVLLVHSVVTLYDGISNVIVAHYKYLQSLGIFDITVVTQWECESVEIKDHACFSDPVTFSSSAIFKNSDWIIYHFGITYELFETIAVAGRHAFVMGVFHNITPTELVSNELKPKVVRSHDQIKLFYHAEHVVCMSSENREVLLEAVPNVQTTILGHSLNQDTLGRFRENKPSFDSGIINICFIGRITKSKGLLDLAQALTLLTQSTLNSSLEIRLSLLSRLASCSSEYYHEVLKVFDNLQSPRIEIEFFFDRPDSFKEEILDDADIFVLPSYHEGFGIPIIEALCHSCVVVAYDNSNIPAASLGLGRHVQTGNISALASALNAACHEVRSPKWILDGFQEYVKLVNSKLLDYAMANSPDRLLDPLPQYIKKPGSRQALDKPTKALNAYPDFDSLRLHNAQIRAMTRLSLDGIRPTSKDYKRQFVALIKSSLPMDYSMTDSCIVHISPQMILSRGYSTGKLCPQSGDLVVDLSPGCFLWGPYVSLPPGSYRVEFQMSRIGGPVQIRLDAHSNSVVMIEQVVSLEAGSRELLNFDFELKEIVHDLEFRAHADVFPAGAQVRLSHVALRELQ